MSPPAGGGAAPPCTICGEPLPRSWSCRECHPEVCHDCWQLSLAQGYDAREHRLPPMPLILTPRDVQSLQRYLAHRDAVRAQEEDTP